MILNMTIIVVIMHDPYIYIYRYVYIYIYIYTCMYIYIYIHTYIHLYLFLSISLSLSLYIYIYITWRSGCSSKAAPLLVQCPSTISVEALLLPCLLAPCDSMYVLNTSSGAPVVRGSHLSNAFLSNTCFLPKWRTM